MQILEFYNAIREMLYQGTGVPVYSEATYETQDAALPCIVFSRDGTSGEQTMTGPSLLTEVVTFSAKAPTIDEVERLREYIISSLNGYSNEIQIVLVGESNEFDNYNKLYSRDISFSIMYGSTSVLTTGSFGSSTITSASYATNAGTADTAGTASYAITASYALTSAGTSSNAVTAVTASYALTASYVLGQSATASYAINAGTAVSASYTTNAGTANTASYAVTAAYAANVAAPTWDTVTGKPTVFSSSAQVDYTGIQNKPTSIATASYAVTASYVLGQSTTASYAITAGTAATASYVLGQSATASYAINAGTAETASYYDLPDNLVSSSAQLSNGGGVPFTSANKVTFGELTSSNANLTVITASEMYASGTNIFGDNSGDIHRFIGTVEATGSFKVSGSLSIIGLFDATASYAITASHAINSISASYSTNATNANSATTATSASFATNSLSSVSSSYASASTTSLTSTSASYATTAGNSLTSTSASFATNALTASFALNGNSSAISLDDLWCYTGI